MTDDEQTRYVALLDANRRHHERNQQVYEQGTVHRCHLGLQQPIQIGLAVTGRRSSPEEMGAISQCLIRNTTEKLELLTVLKGCIVGQAIQVNDRQQPIVGGLATNS